MTEARGHGHDAGENAMNEAIMEQRAARLGEMLRLLDPDEITVWRSAAAIRPAVQRQYVRERRSTWLSAAVIVVLAGTVLATVAPVRAAVADGFRAVASALGIGNEAQPVVVDYAPPRESVRTTFAWTGGVFGIEVPDDAGVTVTVERGTAGTASVVHGPDVAVVVVPAGLRVVPGTASATIVVQLPASVGVLRMTQGARTTEHALTANRSVIQAVPNR